MKYRASLAEAMSQINNTLTKANVDIQDIKDPDELVLALKDSYLSVLESMCGTLDYANNIQMLSRMTKKLSQDRQEPQEAKGNIDIFEKIEKLSYDFILRLRKHEMEHTHVEEQLAGVSKEQKAIQRLIMEQLGKYEQVHKKKYGDVIPDELNFARYFQEQQKIFNL